MTPALLPRHVLGCKPTIEYQSYCLHLFLGFISLGWAKHEVQSRLILSILFLLFARQAEQMFGLVYMVGVCLCEMYVCVEEAAEISIIGLHRYFAVSLW
jgi:hypothetical protein